MSELRESKNEIYIDGTLAEIALEEKSFEKNGAMMPCIRGYIRIKVNEVINGENKELSIPVNYFQAKYKNDGTINKCYTGLQTAMAEYKPLSICENPSDATRVRVSKAQIDWNAYYGEDGVLHQSPRIKASFINSVKPGKDVQDRAIFDAEMFITSISRVMDKDGIEVDPAKLNVKGWMVGYNNSVMPMEFFAINPNVINAVENYWSVGDTVALHGKMNFSFRIETTTEQIGFGEPVTKAKTISSNEFVITAGSETGLDGDFSYNLEDLKPAITNYKAKVEASKDKKPREKTMTSAPVIKENDFNEYGF